MKKFYFSLFVIFGSLLFFWKTNDFHRTLGMLYGLIIAVMLNLQSYRLIERSVNKIRKGANVTLFSLLAGEAMKFVFLWAMLVIGYKGLHLPAKEMLFSFIFYYLCFIVLNVLPEGHQCQKKL